MNTPLTDTLLPPRSSHGPPLPHPIAKLCFAHPSPGRHLSEGGRERFRREGWVPRGPRDGGRARKLARWSLCPRSASLGARASQTGSPWENGYSGLVKS